MQINTSKKPLLRIGTIILFILLLTGCLSSNNGKTISEKMEFWQNQKKGANGNWQTVKPEWFQAADEMGFQFVRFNASWFKADEYDFLIGNVDHFTEINQNDLSVLLQALDEAYRNNQKVVLTMFELPGCRDSNATKENDYRLWQNELFQQQAFDFWRQLAKAVKDHPAIVAYNPLNEPHPERAFGYHSPNADFKQWLKKVKGTNADLNRFNSRMVETIRQVDPDMPILLDGYFYADPSGLPYMKAIDDPNILYAFHNPAPWEFTTYRANNGRYRYPDQMPDYGSGSVWTKDDLEKLLEPVLQFMNENNISPIRLLLANFGVTVELMVVKCILQIYYLSIMKNNGIGLFMHFEKI